MYRGHLLDIILMSESRSTSGMSYPTSYLSLDDEGDDVLAEVQRLIAFLKPGTQVILSLQTYPGSGKPRYRSRWDYTVPDV